MGRIPQTRMSLSGEVRKQRNEITNKGTLFEGTGIHFTSPGVVQVDGTMQVTGSIEVDGSASFGGDTTIGGNAAITGTLSLPAGIIDNDALTNPLDPARLHDEADAFAVTGTGSSWNNILSVSVTVPTGFTQALVLNAVTAVSARNNSASPDFVYARCQANGTSLGGWILASTTTAPGDYGITNQIQTGLLEGLSPGSTLTFTGQVSVTSSWGTDASNIANLDVVLLWLR